MNLVKPRTFRSRVYLAFIRTHRCFHCHASAPSEASHYGGKGASGGTGLKASDLNTAPLCHTCHAHWEDHRTLPGLTVAESKAAHMRANRDLLAKAFEKMADRYAASLESLK